MHLVLHPGNSVRIKYIKINNSANCSQGNSFRESGKNILYLSWQNNNDLERNPNNEDSFNLNDN